MLLCLLCAAAAACKEGGVKVSSFKFTGTKAVSTGQLKSVLATASSSWLPWGTKRYFSREQFEADLKRIVAFYKDRGYPDARVTSFDAKLNDTQTSVSITVNIEEGEPVRVERLTLEGFEPLAEARRSALEAQLPLKAGAAVDRALLQANRETALDELRDAGYPYASVRLSESAGSNERLRVISLRAEPGPLSTFGPVEIAGNKSVSENVIRRQLTYRPGRMFRQSALQSSQRRLYSQELFEFANVEPLRTEDKPTEIPTRVTVTEGKHKKINFGIGYGSEERARAEVDWRHVNFLGGARTFGVFARYSSLDRGVRLNFKEPYFFAPGFSLGLSGQSWHSDEPAFTLDTNGGRATITREFRARGPRILGPRPAMTVSVTYANEHESYQIFQEALDDPSFRDNLIALGLDPETGSGRGTRSAVSLEAARNTTNSLLDARQGYLLSAHLEQAGKWLGGSFDYYELTTEARAYRSVGQQAVVAVQARIGSIDAFARGDPESRGAVLQAVFPWRSDEPARMGTVRSVTADRRRRPDRRHVVPERVSRAAPGRVGQSRRGPLRRCRQRLDEPVGLQPARSALRHRTGAALQDTGRAVSLRRRLSAESNSGSPGQRQEAAAASPVPLQHRPGVLAAAA